MRPLNRFLLALVCSAGVASAQTPALSPEFEVNTYTAGYQFWPVVASDSSGNLVVVWTSREQDGSGDGIFGRRFDSSGNPQGDEFQVNTYTTGYQSGPDLAMDAAGSFVIVWDKDTVSEGEIAARRFDSSGSPLGDEFSVTSRGNSPRVAMNGTGDFVVVWLSHRQNDDGLGILGRSYDSAGISQGGTFQVNSYTTGDQYQPRVAVQETGDFIVAWTDNRLFAPTGGRDGSGRGIFAQRFDASGSKQGGDFQVNSYTTGYQENADITVDATGNYVIVWDSGGRGVSAQRFDASGNKLGGEIPVNSSTTGEYAPDVAADPDGNFIVTWWREDPQDPDVLAQRFHADGTRRGAEFKLDSVIPAWWSPASVTTSGEGRFAVAWTAIDGDGVGIAARMGGETCVPDPGTLCLNSDRFKVQVTWSVPSQGRSGTGKAVSLTGDTGYFWFFNDANIELVLKALDGTSVNGYYWVFYGALSSVQYTITVTDTVTGAVKTYENPAGTLASVADTSAFIPVGAALQAPESSAEEIEIRSAAELYALYEVMKEARVPKSVTVPAACTTGDITLCLNQSRFQVTVDWEVPSQGRSGQGTAVPVTSDTGYFWFFNDANVELVIKVLDGQSINGHYWVFYGALSNVEYTITVTDTQTGAVKTYENPSGTLGSVADTSAF